MDVGRGKLGGQAQLNDVDRARLQRTDRPVRLAREAPEKLPEFQSGKSYKADVSKGTFNFGVKLRHVGEKEAVKMVCNCGSVYRDQLSASCKTCGILRPKCMCGALILDLQDSCNKCKNVRFKCRCGKAVTDNKEFCTNCGMVRPKCTECGLVFHDDRPRCMSCTAYRNACGLCQCYIMDDGPFCEQCKGERARCLCGLVVIDNRPHCGACGVERLGCKCRVIIWDKRPKCDNCGIARQLCECGDVISDVSPYCLKCGSTRNKCKCGNLIIGGADHCVSCLKQIAEAERERESLKDEDSQLGEASTWNDNGAVKKNKAISKGSTCRTKKPLKHQVDKGYKAASIEALPLAKFEASTPTTLSSMRVEGLLVTGDHPGNYGDVGEYFTFDPSVADEFFGTSDWDNCTFAVQVGLQRGVIKVYREEFKFGGQAAGHWMDCPRPGDWAFGMLISEQVDLIVTDLGTDASGEDFGFVTENANRFFGTTEWNRQSYDCFCNRTKGILQVFKEVNKGHNVGYWMDKKLASGFDWTLGAIIRHNGDVLEAIGINGNGKQFKFDAADADDFLGTSSWTQEYGFVENVGKGRKICLDRVKCEGWFIEGAEGDWRGNELINRMPIQTRGGKRKREGNMNVIVVHHYNQIKSVKDSGTSQKETVLCDCGSFFLTGAQFCGQCGSPRPSKDGFSLSCFMDTTQGHTFHQYDIARKKGLEAGKEAMAEGQSVDDASRVAALAAKAAGGYVEAIKFCASTIASDCSIALKRAPHEAGQAARSAVLAAKGTRSDAAIAAGEAAASVSNAQGMQAKVVVNAAADAAKSSSGSKSDIAIASGMATGMIEILAGKNEAAAAKSAASVTIAAGGLTSDMAHVCGTIAGKCSVARKSSAQSAGQAASDAVKACKGTNSDIIIAAAIAAAILSESKGISFAGVGEAVARAVESAGGGRDEVALAAGLAAGHAATRSGASPRDVASAAMCSAEVERGSDNVVSEAVGTTTGVAGGTCVIAHDGMSEEAVDVAIEAVKQNAGGDDAACVKAAEVAGAMVAMACAQSPDAAGSAVAASLGGLSVATDRIAREAGLVAGRVALMTSPLGAAEVGILAARNHGGSSECVARVGAAIAAASVIWVGKGPSDAGKIAQHAILGIGLDVSSVSLGAGEAATIVAIAKGQTPKQITQAAIASAKATNGSTSDCAMAAGLAAGRAEIVNGSTVSMAAKAAVAAVNAQKGKSSDLAYVGGNIAGESALASWKSAEEANQAATDAVKMAKGAPEDVLNAGSLAERIVRGARMEPIIFASQVAKASTAKSESAPTTSGPAAVALKEFVVRRKVGDNPLVIAVMAGHCAGEAALKESMSSQQAGEEAAKGTKEGEANSSQVALSAGAAAAAVAIGNKAPSKDLSKIVGQATEAAGGTRADIATAYVLAIGRASLVVNKGTIAALKSAGVAALKEGLASEKVAFIMALVAVLGAATENLSPAETGEATALACRAAGCLPSDIAEAAGIAAGRVAVARGNEAAKASMIAVQACKLASGITICVAHVAGVIAGEGGAAAGEQPSAAAAAAVISNGSGKAAGVVAAAIASRIVAVARGMDTADVRAAVAEAVREAGGTANDVARAVGNAAAQDAILADTVPLGVGKIAVLAALECEASSAHLCASIGAKAAGQAALGSQVSASEAGKAAAEAARIAGAGTSGEALSAAEAATIVCIGTKMSLEEIGLAAKGAATAERGSPSDIAVAVGLAMGRAELADCKRPEECVPLGAMECKKFGGLQTDIIMVAVTLATEAAFSHGWTPERAADAAAQAVSKASGLQDDVARAAAAAAIVIAKILKLDEAETDGVATKVAREAGTTNLPKVVGSGAGDAAIILGYSIENAAKIAARTAQRLGGKEDVVNDIAVCKARGGGELTPEAAGKTAADTIKSAGGSVSGAARAAAVAASQVANASRMTPAKVASAAAEAAKAAGGDKSDIAIATGLALGKVAIEEDTLPADAAQQAAIAARAAGGTVDDVVIVAGIIAGDAAIARKASPIEAAKAAADAVLKAGGTYDGAVEAAGVAAARAALGLGLSPAQVGSSIADAMQAVGAPAARRAKAAVRGVVEAAVTKSMSPEETARLAAKAASDASGGNADVQDAICFGAAAAGIAKGTSPADAASAAAKVCKEFDLDPSDDFDPLEIARVAGNVAGKVAAARGLSPADIGAAAAVAAKQGGATDSTAARAAGMAAGQAALLEGKPIGIVLRTAADATKAIGATPGDYGFVIGEMAGKSALDAGYSPSDAGQAAADILKTRGIAVPEIAEGSGAAAGIVEQDFGKPAKDVGRTADTAAKRAGGSKSDCAIVAGVASGRAALAFGRTPGVAIEEALDACTAAGGTSSDGAIAAGRVMALAAISFGMVPSTAAGQVFARMKERECPRSDRALAAAITAGKVAMAQSDNLLAIACCVADAARFAGASDTETSKLVASALNQAIMMNKSRYGANGKDAFSKAMDAAMSPKRTTKGVEGLSCGECNAAFRKGDQHCRSCFTPRPKCECGQIIFDDFDYCDSCKQKRVRANCGHIVATTHKNCTKCQKPRLCCGSCPLVVFNFSPSCSSCGVKRYTAKCGHVVTDEGKTCSRCGKERDKSKCGHTSVYPGGGCVNRCGEEQVQAKQQTNQLFKMDDGCAYRESEEKFEGPQKNAAMLSVGLGEMLGIAVSKRTCTIKQIQPGVVQRWNDANQAFQIEIGDIVWQVTVVGSGVFSKQPDVEGMIAKLKAKVHFACKFRKKNGKQEIEAFGGKVGKASFEVKKQAALNLKSVSPLPLTPSKKKVQPADDNEPAPAPDRASRKKAPRADANPPAPGKKKEVQNVEKSSGNTTNGAKALRVRSGNV